MATVFWFTGLSGAGKSTIARSFYEELRTLHPSLFLDGDELREALGAQNTFSLEERRALAFQYARLCLLLVKQDLHVICATVSMFEEIRNWNRKTIPHYLEIYVKAPFSILKKRKESLYSSPNTKHIVGLDLPFDEPKNPDIVLNNDGSIPLAEHLDYLRVYLQKLQYV